MKIDVEQVWEYEIKPTDTLRLLCAFKNHWESVGDEFVLENRGGRMFAVRRSKTELKPNTISDEVKEHYHKLYEYYKEKYEQ